MSRHASFLLRVLLILLLPAGIPPTVAALDGRMPLTLEAARARTPQPLKFITFEGRLKTEPARQTAVAALADVDAAIILADSFLTGNDPSDRSKAMSFVGAWANRYVPDGNPINEKELAPLILVYGLFRTEWPAAERQRIDHWLYDLADAQLRHRTALNHRTRDNWNSKRIFIVATIAAATRNDYWWRTAAILLREHISSSLYSDGSSFDLLRRDALHYHISNVLPLVQTAVLFHLRDGNDHYHWLGPHGVSVARSVDFVRPYFRGEKSRYDWRNSTVRFDHDRGASGDPEFDRNRTWDPVEANELMAIATYFEAPIAAGPGPLQPAGGDEWFLRLVRAAVAPEPR